jgi:hypothetical protein
VTTATKTSYQGLVGSYWGSPGSYWRLLAGIAVLALMLFGTTVIARTEPVNAHAAAVAEFNKRVKDYVDLRKKQSSGLLPLKKTDDPEAIVRAEHALGDSIRAARATAKQGDLFTPAITPTFQTAIKQYYQRQPHQPRKEMLDEVPDFHPAVNQIYPEKLPKGTFPVSLLQELPQLPEDVEYRIVGTFLILRDGKANLIVDYIPAVLPPAAKKEEGKS